MAALAAPGKGADKSLRGFSILEMVVVLALIGLIAAMVVPRVGLLDGVQLKASARNLSGTIRLTYATAVMKRTAHRIVFDLSEQTYRVEEQSGEEWTGVADPMLGERVLPGNVMFKKVEVMDRYCESFCEEYLYFTPGGYVEEAALYLTLDGDDRVFTVFTRPMTGRSVIVMEEMTREQWEKSEEYH